MLGLVSACMPIVEVTNECRAYVVRNDEQARVNLYTT